MNPNLGVSPLCVKCKRNPRRGEASTTCVECHRAYMKDYVKRHKGSRERMSKTKGFQEGAQAMREKILAECRTQNPQGMIRVGEFATWVARMTLPRPKPESAKKESAPASTA